MLTPVAAVSGMTPLILCRVLMGLGEGVTMPSVHALIGEWLPPEVRGHLQATNQGQDLGQGDTVRMTTHLSCQLSTLCSARCTSVEQCEYTAHDVTMWKPKDLTSHLWM